MESGAGKRQQKPKKRTRASTDAQQTTRNLNYCVYSQPKKPNTKGRRKEGRKVARASERASKQASEVTNYVSTQQQQQLPHEKERKKERKFIPTEKHGRNKD